jgi:acyl-CoA reductase-like NAD-dependent aldehyde dehydrogenase
MTGHAGARIRSEPVSEVAHPVISPATGEILDHVALTTREGLDRILSRLPLHPPETSADEVFAFLRRLQEQMRKGRDLLVQTTALETGFIFSDSREIVDGAIEFLGDFETYTREQQPRRQVIRHSYSAASPRDMRITHRPIRGIAAIVPQNASLTLGVTILASALHAGTRVLLRPSLQNGVSGALLAEAVRASNPPESSVVIVNCLASEFLDACCASDKVELIHHIGGNRFALSVFEQAFSAGKTCLLDGQGNGLLYADESFPVEEAARLITSGATRFNGETCTSVNGALIHRAIYEPLKEALVEAFRRLTVGHPLAADSLVGPLFSEKQALGLQRTLADTPGAHILCGGRLHGAYFAPAILEGVCPDQMVVREGFFGPALWIRAVSEDEVEGWFRANRYPLSDTVLSRRGPVLRRIAHHSRAARICVNEDPSIESMFEPWGGYPPSGFNPVSIWAEKYRQSYQVDGRLKEILAVFPDP